MKKIAKWSLMVFSLILLSGCLGNMTPSEKVEDMFGRYIRNDINIMNELDSYLDKQDLSKNQKERYKKIIKDEYATIEYDIKDEKINGDEATVVVDIEVKDLYRASKEAGDYLLDNAEEFYTDSVYDKDKFIDYKLGVMEKNKNTIKYTIDIDLKKKDGTWVIKNLDNTTLEKIHGIYDYEIDNNK